MNKTRFLVVSLFIIVLIFLVSASYTLMDRQIESTYKISENDIIEKEGKYYLLIDERELDLSDFYYNKFDLEKYNEYKIKYVYNNMKNNDGDVVMVKRYGEQPWGW